MTHKININIRYTVIYLRAVLSDVVHDSLGSLLSHHLLEPFVVQRVFSQQQFFQLETVGQLTGDGLQAVAAQIQLFQDGQAVDIGRHTCDPEKVICI